MEILISLCSPGTQIAFGDQFGANLLWVLHVLVLLPSVFWVDLPRLSIFCDFVWHILWFIPLWSFYLENLCLMEWASRSVDFQLAVRSRFPLFSFLSECRNFRGSQSALWGAEQCRGSTLRRCGEQPRQQQAAAAALAASGKQQRRQQQTASSRPGQAQAAQEHVRQPSSAPPLGKKKLVN